MEILAKSNADFANLWTHDFPSGMFCARRKDTRGPAVVKVTRNGIDALWNRYIAERLRCEIIEATHNSSAYSDYVYKKEKQTKGHSKS